MIAPTNSLAFRLIAIAAVWSVLGLAAGGLILSSIFSRSAQRSFDTRLTADLESVIAAADRDETGKLGVAQSFVDPRYANAFSGWYWEVAPVKPAADANEPVLRSTSLWDQSLEVGVPEAQGVTRVGYTVGPKKQRLRFVERVVSLPDETLSAAAVPQQDRLYRFTVAGDVSDVEAEIDSFNTTLLWSVIVLGAGLIAAMFIQVRLGLTPLRRVRLALADIREGKADKLEGDFPLEIKPLADELNALVAHNAEVVARARTHVGNLAHFLKTPLSVLANEAQSAPKGAFSETVMRQVATMRRQVDHYLARARTVASAAVLGARTEAAPVVSDLTRALSKIYASRGVTIEKECPPGLSFRGDRSDFEELVGNLLDNACKWANEMVTITVAPTGPGRLTVTVSDDGPGLDEEQKKRVLERGERLDESKPGSGLGLGIVKEIASLYGGTLTLSRAESGGLLAALELPAAEARAA